MIVRSSSSGSGYEPAIYRILVAGRLNTEWSDRLGGMGISVIENENKATITELSGQLPDQSALMGVLQELYVCGVTLLRVEYVGRKRGNRAH